MEISLIIPAFNEEKRILNTMVQIIEYMEKTFPSYEIIVVDDGSRDNTAEFARAFSPYVRTISYKDNRGKGYAVAKGVGAARGDFIFFTDADLSYDPENLIRGREVLESGAEVVIGSRDTARCDYPVMRRGISKVYSRVCGKILPLGFGDTQCGFKGFKIGAAKRLFENLTVCGFGFDAEILCRARLLSMEIGQIPISFDHADGSHIKLSSGIKMLCDLCRIRREVLGRGTQK